MGEILKLAIFEKEVKSNYNNCSSGSFESILNRIHSQSYSYSNRNSPGEKGKHTSLFLEYNEGIYYYYIPIYNYFDREATWIKVEAFQKIQLSQKYSYYKYDEYTESDIEKKLQEGTIHNITISKENIRKREVDNSTEQAIYILNEVLYSKKVYIVFCFIAYNQKKWLKTPIESSLSSRGKKTLRTDENGNQFSDNEFTETDRDKTYEFNLDNMCLDKNV